MTHAIISYKEWKKNTPAEPIMYKLIKIDGTSEKDILTEFWLRQNVWYFNQEIINIETYPNQ